MINKFNKQSMILVASMAMFACSDSDEETPIDPDPPQTQTIVDVARGAGNFTVLLGALEATGLDEVLSGSDEFTVMAPTDEAFARLPEGVVASLDADTLTEILTYHVVAGSVRAETVVTLDSADSVEGAAIAIDASNGVLLNGITKVVDTDIEADNGIIHVIDSVMLPPDFDFPGTIVEAAQAYPIFDPLVGALVTAELAETLGTDNEGDGFTVFAPIDSAFTAIEDTVATLSVQELTNVLLYHAVGATVDSGTATGLEEADTLLDGSVIDLEVEGGELILNGSATVIRADLNGSNGVIHVIDEVLLP